MIVIGSDHAGIELKKEIIEYLSKKHIDVMDVSEFNDSQDDYPDIAIKVCENVLKDSSNMGIAICGTGIGMSLAANKVKGVRAAVVSDAFSTKYTRLHNDTNILCLGERVIGPGLAAMLVDIFLTTEFEGGRHQVRVDMIMDLEK